MGSTSNLLKEKKTTMNPKRQVIWNYWVRGWKKERWKKLKIPVQGLPGGPVIESPPSNAGDASSFSGWKLRSLMPWCISHTPQLMSPLTQPERSHVPQWKPASCLNPCASTRIWRSQKIKQISIYQKMILNVHRPGFIFSKPGFNSVNQELPDVQSGFSRRA